MAKITQVSSDRTSAPFVAEPMHPQTLVPGGAKIEADDWSEVSGKKRIPAGTLVGRAYTDRATMHGFSPISYTPGPPKVIDQEEMYLVAFDVEDANVNTDVELLRHGTVIYEDRLPGWSSLDALAKAFIREHYECIISVDA